MKKDFNIGVLFDLDGVLIDTESQYSIFWKAIGIKHKIAYDDFAERIKGSNLTSILNNYFPNKDTQQDIIKELDLFQANMNYEIYPGVKEFIEELITNNIPICIVTSSDDKKMENLFLRQPYLKEKIQNLITGDQVINSKPDPECFIKGAAKIGVNIDNCYIFEDSIQGITAGLSSGATVIALKTTVSEDKIKQLTNNIIDNFKGFSIKEMLKY